MNVRGLLFDFDGLLVDTETPGRRSWEEIYREHGHELPLDQWATKIGTIGTPFDPATHLGELLGTELDHEALRAKRRARHHELIDLEDLRPGVDDYLATAKERGLKTAIVSSSETWWIEQRLEHLGHGHDWDVVVAANGDRERAKPRPDLYLEGLEHLGIRADEGIAFEDSPNGLRAAKAAGLYCVAVPNPVTATLAFDEADLVLESLADLPLDELLDRM